jgi:hypothetical protein
MLLLLLLASITTLVHVEAVPPSSPESIHISTAPSPSLPAKFSKKASPMGPAGAWVSVYSRSVPLAAL